VCVVCIFVGGVCVCVCVVCVYSCSDVVLGIYVKFRQVIQINHKK